MTTIHICLYFKEILLQKDKSGIITEICQNERTNHTLDTAQRRMVFVHALRQRLDAPYSSDAASKAAQKLRSSSTSGTAPSL